MRRAATERKAAAKAPPGRPPPPPGSYLRVGRGLEFDRVSIFSDAVYAIALTLLVVALEAPEAPEAAGDPGALRAALARAQPNIVGFFIGFVLLGRYWLAHHQFFASLRSIDRKLIALNLVYLAFVAFMPFPVALISEFEQNPLAFYIFAGCLTIISALEVALFAWAAHRGHTRLPLSGRMIRHGLLASGMPVLVLLASFPLAALNPTYALFSWLVILPLSAALNRRAPRAQRDDA